MDAGNYLLLETAGAAALVLIEVAGEHGRKPSPPVSSFYMPPVSPFPHITTARSESFDLPDG
jgi:hypothetical protein